MADNFPSVDPSGMPPAPGTHPHAPWQPPTTSPQSATAVMAQAPPVLPDASAPSPAKKPWWIAVAAVAIVVLGLGAIFALRANSDDVADETTPDAVDAVDDGDVAIELPEAESFSLSAAAEQAAAANTVEFDMTMGVGGIGDVEMSGGIDSAAQLMTMRMDMGALLGGGLGLGGDGMIDLILDGANGVMYMDATAFGEGLPTNGASWILFDFETLAAQSGQSVDDFSDSFITNPLDAAVLFDQADPDDIVEVGIEDIDGTPTMHFEVTVDFAAVVEANPQLQGQVDADLTGADLPDDIVYDVWVTEGNQIRRMAFDMDVDGQSIAVTMNMRQVGGSLDVAIPSGDDVFDMSVLLGG